MNVRLTIIIGIVFLSLIFLAVGLIGKGFLWIAGVLIILITLFIRVIVGEITRITENIIFLLLCIIMIFTLLLVVCGY
ncbi:MAG: hypothetical protein NTX22_01040 [Ignavibacteriales bacterium]|nr:hypothetical protein [Ignavibacteriales bacterium]